jgi:UDP-2,3-diacylglucosamine hydrolase
VKTIVLSDVHLQATPEGMERALPFRRFLERIDPQHTNRLIVLGDLFDFWFEYRHVIFSGYFPILRQFADLCDNGVELHLVCGNHDFWAGRFLREDLGMHVHQAAVTLPFGGDRVLLVHGDGINPADKGYRIYKRIARTPGVLWAFRQLHPDLAMGLARAVSHGSRRFFGAKDASKGPEVAPLRAFAQETLRQGEADVVMCGHSHYPVCEEMSTGTGQGAYINTGDWLMHQSYVEWEDGVFRLLREQAGVADVIAAYETQRPVEQKQ